MRRRVERIRLPGYTRRKIAPGVVSLTRKGEGHYDTDLPWIVWFFGRTHDQFWPPWNSTRVLGRMCVELECAVCGERLRLWLRIPRFGAVNPERREHPARTRFKLDHIHKDRPSPFAWARPLLNPAAHGPGGIDLDALAMRLEADLREAAG